MNFWEVDWMEFVSFMQGVRQTKEIVENFVEMLKVGWENWMMRFVRFNGILIR